MDILEQHHQQLQHHLKQDSNGNVSTIYLKMDNKSAGLQAIRSDTYGSQHNLVPIRRIEREISINSKSACSPTIKRLQFPIILSWASTIHKVQRKTFQKVVVCYDLFKQRTFNPGQIYVALSHVTSLDGLYLTGSYNRKALKVDQWATEQYDYMRKNCQFQRVEDDCSIADNSLVVTLLNVRSLRKHSIDVSYDTSIMKSDIIAFTKTELSHDCSSLYQDLHPLMLITNNLSQNSYSNVAFAHRDTLSLLNVENAPGATFLKINKQPFSRGPINLLLLYRSHTIGQNNFAGIIRYFLLGENDIHMILGDFNINALEGNDYMSQNLSNYKMIVTSPTHISGSLLDHIYVLRKFFEKFKVANYIKSVYFSDHDAVKCII